MPKPIKQYTIGVDIGGTKMSAVLFDGVKVIADYTLATPKDNLEHFMIMLKALVEPLLEKAKKGRIEVKDIGISIAGMLDKESQKMLRSPNLPTLDGAELAKEFTDKLGLPIKIDNDTNCFLRAEMKFGAGRKYANAFGIIIGTGIGGAWWHNGEIYKGVHGTAGEAGWVVIDYKEGVRLEEAYHKLMQNNPASLAEEAYRGDVLAEKTFKEVGYDLGVSLANIVNLIDPEIIIIGGGVSQSSDLFLSQLKKTMKQYIVPPEAKRVKVVVGKLGSLAGAIGAALLVNNQ